MLLSFFARLHDDLDASVISQAFALNAKLSQGNVIFRREEPPLRSALRCMILLRQYHLLDKHAPPSITAEEATNWKATLSSSTAANLSLRACTISLDLLSTTLPKKE